MDRPDQHDLADTVGTDVGRLDLIKEIAAKVEGLDADASDDDLDQWWGSVEGDRLVSGLTLATIASFLSRTAKTVLPVPGFRNLISREISLPSSRRRAKKRSGRSALPEVPGLPARDVLRPATSPASEARWPPSSTHDKIAAIFGAAENVIGRPAAEATCSAARARAPYRQRVRRRPIRPSLPVRLRRPALSVGHPAARSR